MSLLISAQRSSFSSEGKLELLEELRAIRELAAQLAFVFLLHAALA